jgi:hypothetical protein
MFAYWDKTQALILLFMFEEKALLLLLWLPHFSGVPPAGIFLAQGDPTEVHKGGFSRSWNCKKPESQVSVMANSSDSLNENRRRKTIFRKVKQLSDTYNTKAFVFLLDREGNYWIYRSHGNMPITEAVRTGLMSKEKRHWTFQGNTPPSNSVDLWLWATKTQWGESGVSRTTPKTDTDAPCVWASGWLICDWTGGTGRDINLEYIPFSFRVFFYVEHSFHMHKMESVLVESIELTFLDHVILQHGYLTVNAERLPSVIQEMKNQQLTSVDLIRENGRLREEIAYHQEAQQIFWMLFEKTKDAQRLLRECLNVIETEPSSQSASDLIAESAATASKVLSTVLKDTSHKLAASESRLLDYFGISLDNTSTLDFTILWGYLPSYMMNVGGSKP